MIARGGRGGGGSRPAQLCSTRLSWPSLRGHPSTPRRESVCFRRCIRGTRRMERRRRRRHRWIRKRHGQSRRWCIGHSYRWRRTQGSYYCCRGRGRLRFSLLLLLRPGRRRRRLEPANRVAATAQMVAAAAVRAARRAKAVRAEPAVSLLQAAGTGSLATTPH